MNEARCPECEQVKPIPPDLAICEDCNRYWLDQEERERALENASPLNQNEGPA